MPFLRFNFTFKLAGILRQWRLGVACLDTSRPSDFTDENVSEIKNVLVMFDAAIGNNVSSEVENNTETDGEYSAYTYKMTVNYGGENAVMYYNETNVKTKTEEDDGENSTETSATLVGVMVVGENAFEPAGKRKEETKADEKEFELELAVKKANRISSYSLMKRKTKKVKTKPNMSAKFTRAAKKFRKPNLK